MMFSGKIFTIISAVLAITVNGSPNGRVRAEALGNVQLCTDSVYQGNCVTLSVDAGVCKNVPTDFDNDVSSVGVGQGMGCTIFDDINCGGKSLFLRPPGSQNLNDVGFNDITSAVKCNRL